MTAWLKFMSLGTGELVVERVWAVLIRENEAVRLLLDPGHRDREDRGLEGSKPSRVDLVEPLFVSGLCVSADSGHHLYLSQQHDVGTQVYPRKPGNL